MFVIAVGGLNTVAALLAAADAVAGHKTRNAVATVAASESTEVDVDPGRSVGLSAVAVQGDNDLGEGDFLNGTRAG